VKRILVAEDEASVREFVGRALTGQGYEVVTVRDGSAALAALREKPFDLLLADIMMPGIDGIELALMAARDQPGLPILLMTGHPEQRERAHNLSDLIADVVAKPFTVDQIRAAVRAALG
jgi:two-component system, cell cycle response regulator CpdR